MYAHPSLLSPFLFVSLHHPSLCSALTWPLFTLSISPASHLEVWYRLSLIARHSLTTSLFLLTTSKMHLVKAGSLRHHAAVHAVGLEAAAPSALQCNPRPLLQVRLRGIGTHAGPPIMSLPPKGPPMPIPFCSSGCLSAVFARSSLISFSSAATCHCQLV